MLERLHRRQCITDNNMNPLSVLHDVEKHSFVFNSIQLVHKILDVNKWNGIIKFNLTPTLHDQVQISANKTYLCNTVGPPQQ